MRVGFQGIPCLLLLSVPFAPAALRAQGTAVGQARSGGGQSSSQPGSQPGSQGRPVQTQVQTEIQTGTGAANQPANAAAATQTGTASTGPPPPRPGAITLEQALDRALRGNPALASGREHVAATRATRVTAGLRQNPQLTLLGQGVTLPEVNNDGGNPFYYSANVARLFERGQKRRWRLDLATATADQTEDQFRDQERQVSLQVRIAFTNLLVAKSALFIAQENLVDFRRTVELSKARLDAGDIDKTDFERVDLQLAQFESDFDQAQLTILQSSAQLQLLFGIAHPDPNFDIDGSLDLNRATAALNLTREEAEARALARRPDLLAADAGFRSAQAAARAALAGGTADPTIAAEYERSGAANTLGASVVVPLRLFDRNQGEKERTRFEVNASRFALEAARNQVVNDVDQAWDALTTARAQARRYNEHYLDEAARVRDNLQFSYRNGASTLLDYLGALRDFRAVSLASAQANSQVWLALHQLYFASATDVLP